MRNFLILLSLLGLPGCTASEDAGLTGRPLSTRDADRQYKARLLELHDGKTTRQDILSVMGDPDRENDRFLMYYWTVKDREWDGLVRSFVLAEFDARGVLVRHKQVDEPAKEFGGPKLPPEAWAEFTGEASP